ncbi:MAG: ATP-binding protein [Candidatus Sigynarchaeota archaeon]
MIKNGQNANTILVVDDDEGIRDTLADIFEENGFNVLLAQDGTIAKEKTSSTDVNVAIIDIMLPDMDGISLLKEIKRINPRCACMIITGHASLQNATKALKDGADGYFIKPVVIDEVLYKIREIFEKQRLLHDLEESEEKFRVLAEQSSVGIVIIVNNIISFANEAISRIFDESLENIVNHQSNVLTNMIDGADRTSFHGMIDEKCDLNRSSEARTLHVVNRTGKRKWVDVHPRNITYKGIRARSLAMIDISNEIEAKEKLNALNLALENKIHERTLELEEANRAKSAFLAHLSHELRTPLNAIIGFTEALLNGYAGELSNAQQEYITDIFESGEILLALINEVLDLSKIEAGKMTILPQKIEIMPLFEKCLAMFKEKMTEHCIISSIEIQNGMSYIIADEIRIKQILFNLLSNALKFTADGGRIGIKASETCDESVISVWDTGIGIAQQDLGRLFQPFERIEYGRNKEITGTGIGLHLTKKIVELHNGRIWVESEVGKGSSFSFTLPRNQNSKKCGCD